MAEFVNKAPKQYDFNCTQRQVLSPRGFVRPQYGAAQQFVSVDDSASLDMKGISLLQHNIANFLWYYRMLDFTCLVALSQLAQAIAHLTNNTLMAAHHLLRYFATYPSDTRRLTRILNLFGRLVDL